MKRLLLMLLSIGLVSVIMFGGCAAPASAPTPATARPSAPAPATAPASSPAPAPKPAPASSPAPAPKPAKKLALKLNSVMAASETEVSHMLLAKYVKRINESFPELPHIELYPNSSLIPLPQGLDALSSGIIDMLYAQVSFYGGPVPAGDALNLPLAYKSSDDFLEVLASPQLKGLFDEAYGKINVKVIGSFVMAGDILVTAKKPVSSLADMKGLKIRSRGGLQNDIIVALGAAPVFIAWGETEQALDKGIADGLLTSIEPIIGSPGVLRVTKHVTFPPVTNPSSISLFVRYYPRCCAFCGVTSHRISSGNCLPAISLVVAFYDALELDSHTVTAIWIACQRVDISRDIRDYQLRNFPRSQNQPGWYHNGSPAPRFSYVS